MVGALELWSSGGLWCAFPRFPGSIHGAAGVTSHSTAGVPGSKKGKKKLPKRVKKGQQSSGRVNRGGGQSATFSRFPGSIQGLVSRSTAGALEG